MSKVDTFYWTRENKIIPPAMQEWFEEQKEKLNDEVYRTITEASA